jgi:hypothetical protein
MEGRPRLEARYKKACPGRELRKALPFKYREVEITRQEALRLRLISSFADDEFEQEIEALLE